MLKLSVGKGRQVMKHLCCRVSQYYVTVATERAGYVLCRALVIVISIERWDRVSNELTLVEVA